VIECSKAPAISLDTRGPIGGRVCVWVWGYMVCLVARELLTTADLFLGSPLTVGIVVAVGTALP
jgi:hypothetical protein